MQDSGNGALPPAVNTLFAETTAAQCEPAAPTTDTTEPAKQERLAILLICYLRHYLRHNQTQFFSTLDLAAGYWQVRMDKASQEKTAFNTHSGHYEFA